MGDKLSLEDREKIANQIFIYLNGVYCDTCRFMSLSEEDSERVYGYYGCEDCIRKSMNWEISEEASLELADKILGTNL